MTRLPIGISSPIFFVNIFSRNIGDDQNVIVEERISTVSGETAVRRYNRGHLLGKGGFAKCYEFVNLETKKVSAAKIINKASLTKSRAKQKVRQFVNSH